MAKVLWSQCIPSERFGCGVSKGKMEVIAHDHIGVQPPGESPTRLIDGSFKRLRCADRGKHIPTIIASVDDVIQRARILNA
jgi:hypothetical protein